MIERAILLALLAAGASACATEQRTVVVADDACHAYGFRVGTPEYRLCQDREAAARRAGRVPYGYSQAALVADARAACESYGLTPYSDRYDECVRQEYAARRPI